jgi:hypothetical protein
MEFHEKVGGEFREHGLKEAPSEGEESPISNIPFPLIEMATGFLLESLEEMSKRLTIVPAALGKNRAKNAQLSPRTNALPEQLSPTTW